MAWILLLAMAAFARHHAMARIIDYANTMQSCSSGEPKAVGDISPRQVGIYAPLYPLGELFQDTGRSGLLQNRVWMT
ncbi:hypothetical protein N7451_005499 [Penicillium sp. IBT 35674x]|nr:hypothetical protein N7451_005499 [Penicillium sp. IBT 35674x]